jgi:hypothetical protein
MERLDVLAATALYAIASLLGQRSAAGRPVTSS